MPKPAAQLKAAKRHLSEAQLIAFLRAANAKDHTASVEMTCRALDEGRTLEEVFSQWDPADRATDRYRVTIELKVNPLAPNTYEITFGHHGPGYGDGGIWEVLFTDTGKVQLLDNGSFWIH